MEFVLRSPEELKEALRYSDSYSRLATLIELGGVTASFEWLTMLGESWSCCDNISEYMVELFDSHFGCRHPDDLPIREMMSNDEQAEYDALPDFVTVYRGCYAPNKWGLSWSLSEEVATKFPTLSRYRMEGQPLLVRATAKKENIVALKNDRNEAEIITHRPKQISVRHIRN